MRKLIAFLKFAAFMTIIGLAGTVLYLQEWGKGRDFIPDVVAREGLVLPLDEARIVVSTSKKTLTLYAGKVVIKRYDVAVGRNQQCGVIWKGSGSTPLGEYKVIEKRHRDDLWRHGSRFLRLNFPNLESLELAWERERISDEEFDRAAFALEKGQPVEALGCFENEVGIQGNWFHVRGFNVAATGSLSLTNADINELYEYVEVGTPVFIKR